MCVGINCLSSRDLDERSHDLYMDWVKQEREIQDQFITCKIEKIQKAEETCTTLAYNI